jgi:small nuclear ribonucleoprotein
MTKPLDMLKKSLQSKVIVRLKDGRNLRGTLSGYDTHINLVLRDAEEIRNDEAYRKLGDIVIRGDTVVLISPLF